ncbi:hypothetical protein [Paenibacillus lutrae]|uniref:Uncharacterized protein n=1 Tax=Paenibacillus lutrae TaxID=2078573 RepID=A0A7X3JY86_9BACL|nr:hypothetical protein [Paenibacillus lutrae]MVO98806.1 hypothetical protein [Paenibacillus lutrae]
MKKLAKGLTLTTLALSMLIPINAYGSAKPKLKKQIIVISDSAETTISNIKKRDSDETIKKIKEMYNFDKITLSTLKQNNFTIKHSEDSIIVVSFENISSNKDLLNNIINEINKQNLVYIYGKGFTTQDVEQLTGLKIEKRSKEKLEESSVKNQEWQYLGVGKEVDGKFNFDFGQVTYKEADGTYIIPDDSFILQSVINSNKRLELKNEKNKLAPTGYGDDPIVTRDSLSKDGYAFNELKANLSVDWFLHKASDNDAEYDYFYLEDSVELNGYNGYTTGYDLKTWHSLPSASDIIKDWGPDSNSGSTFAVSLPWGVQWQFSTNAAISLTTEGSQADDKVFWNVDERWYQYGISLPLRIRPGTAWASKGTYAMINTQHYGAVRKNGGFDLVELSIDPQVRYDYN